jgi:uncharacterized DUF497 family protein
MDDSSQRSYTGRVEFEWHPDKAATNLRKHGVSFDEAVTVLADPLAITVPDPDHSQNEERFITVGMSFERRLLIVAHTERGERIRLISARELTAIERTAYELGSF